MSKKLIGKKVVIWDKLQQEEHIGYTDGEVLTVKEDVSDTGMRNTYECISDTTGKRYLCTIEELALYPLKKIKTQG